MARHMSKKSEKEIRTTVATIPMITLNNKKGFLALEHLGMQRRVWKMDEDQEHYEEGNYS